MISSLFSTPNYDASKRLLDATLVRHEALAANIANLETPSYKRVDLDRSFTPDFVSCLRGGNVSAAPVPLISEDTGAASQRTDGNTVDLDQELLAMGKNGAEYDVLSEFVSGSLKQLRMAVTGRSF